MIAQMNRRSRSLRKIQDQGAEDLQKILGMFFSRVIDAIVACNGDVVRVAGDAVIAVFGDNETATEFSALCSQACVCALQCLHAVGDIQFGNMALNLHIGIGSGMVHVYHVGRGHQWQYVLCGEPFVQLKSALDAAGPGQVAISQATWALMQQDNVSMHRLSAAVKAWGSNATLQWEHVNDQKDDKCVNILLHVDHDSEKVVETVELFGKGTNEFIPAKEPNILDKDRLKWRDSALDDKNYPSRDSSPRSLKISRSLSEYKPSSTDEHFPPLLKYKRTRSLRYSFDSADLSDVEVCPAFLASRADTCPNITESISEESVSRVSLISTDTLNSNENVIAAEVGLSQRAKLVMCAVKLACPVLENILSCYVPSPVACQLEIGSLDIDSSSHLDGIDSLNLNESFSADESVPKKLSKGRRQRDNLILEDDLAESSDTESEEGFQYSRNFLRSTHELELLADARRVSVLFASPIGLIQEDSVPDERAIQQVLTQMQEAIFSFGFVSIMFSLHKTIVLFFFKY